MKHKITVSLVSSITLLVSSFVYAETDAILISSGMPDKPLITSGHIGQTNSVDTGITIENGDLWIWGFRNSGQQGNGTTSGSNYDQPTRVMAFSGNIVQVAAGIYHVIALDDNGDVWGWGQNGYAEAGAKVCNTAYINYPCKILSGKKVIQIDAGEYNSYALTSGGDVYTWGHGEFGRVGTGSTAATNGLAKLPRSSFGGKSVVQIGAAYEGGYAINSSGQVYAWGDNEDSAFGFGSPGRHAVTTPVEITQYLPVNGNEIEYICGGQRFTNFLTSSGDVYGMGANTMLGIGQNTGNTSYPRKIISNIKTLYCRYGGSVAMTNDRKLYTWGFYNNQFDIYGSTPINRGYHPNITKIDGGKEHIIYWTDKGKGYGVGYAAGNKFGTGAGTSHWPGTELSFVGNAMKAVYGKDYIIGQGY